MPPRKLRTPLFSFTASGRLGQGLSIVRRLAGSVGLLRGRPPFSRTLPQATWRNRWQLAADLWHQLSAAEQAEWESLGTARHMTGYAWYMSQALRPNPGIYLPLAGGTMAGDIAMDGNQITGLVDPTTDDQAARKAYVDAHVGPGAPVISVRVYKALSQDMGSGLFTPIVFDTTDYDATDMHDPGLNPSRITVATAGLYIVHGQIWWQASTTVGERRCLIRLNGATYLSENKQLGTTGATGDLKMSVTTQYIFAAGDYFELVCYQSSGGPLRVMNGVSQSPLLSAVLIG